MGKTKTPTIKQDDMPEDVTSEDVKELQEIMKQLIIVQRRNRKEESERTPTTQDMKEVAKKYLELEKLKESRINGRFLIEFEHGLDTLVQEFSL